MKFWKTTIIFKIYKDKEYTYMLHTNDTATAKSVERYWRDVFSFHGKNGLTKCSAQEITKQEYLDYWAKVGYKEPYGIK